MEKTIAEKKVSFSLAGCGFLGIYHIGAAACLSEHVPHVLEEARFCGASAGALIACSLICNVPMDHCVDFTLRLARSSGQYPLGGWEPTINIEAILRSSIDQVMPADAHQRCTDRLFVSVTSLNGLRNQIISKFRTRKELLDTLMCSAYVPGFSSYTIPRMGEEYFLDGGLSDNLPILDSNTITICPWAGEHSICPQDPEGQSFPLTMMNMSICPSTHNLARFKDAFFCPKPETLKNYCWQGYDDALRFLHENHLIHCKVHRVLAVLTNLEHRMSVDCDDCEHHRDHARNCELPSNIKAYWEDADWWKKVIPRYTGLVLEPVRLMCKIWLVPVTMLRHYVTQLFLLAYFQVDKFRHGGLSAELLRLVKKLGNPRQFLWELLLITMSKVALQIMEYWTRVFSEVCALGQTWKATQRIIRKEICQLCGVGYHLPPGPLLKVKDDQKQADDVTTATLVEGAEKAMARQEEQGVSGVVQEASVSVEASAEGEEARGTSLPEAAETMAVWVDIHANSVDMALPLPEPADQPATEVQAPETVHVEGVGEIQEVVIDPVMMVPAAKADQPEAAQKAAEVSQQKTERIHQYVHKLEHLKSIMTLHYVDENSQRHTESLFVEELSPQASSMESSSGVCPQRPLSGREGPLDKVGSRAGAEVDSIPEEVEEQVDREVKQLLETKLFTGQRQFEKSYEASHQLRLKKKKRREVKKDTGHFSLQLISLGTDNPPSPVLSRSASLRSVMEDDGELVRSVSDACTLASSIRKLREMRKVGVECSSCDSCSSLNEPPLAASHSSLTESSAPCTVHHHRSPSPGIASQQFQLKASPAPLRKCLSDTSEVSANLRLLKMGRLPPQENRTLARESTPVQGDHSHGVGKRPIPRVATAPVLASSPKESPLSADSSGATVGLLSSISRHSLLPVIPDDTACSHPQPVVPCAVSQREVEGEGGAEVSQQAAVTAHTAVLGWSTQHSEVKVPGGGGRLQRSWAIRGSGGQRSQLLSNLRELKAQSSSADSTPISTHPTLVSTGTASSSAHATPPTTDPVYNTTSPSATTISISTPAITISSLATPSSIHTASSIADTSSNTVSTSATTITSLPATTISTPTAPSSSR